MLNIIDEIIEIDKNARKSVTEAEEKAEDIKNKAKEQAAQIKLEFDERIKRRLAIVTENYTRFAEEEIKEITDKENAAIMRLEDVFDKSSDRWRKEIIARITGTEGYVAE